ncbi:succinyl-diaminopimelate desuccinylase [Streptomyces sp. LMG1-1-1.1]|uniref:succinyl-diaminopimelate desuccinylase n=1 Tax=Streptomyces sp. LMG1-1-1.1 TaxID=3135245 RepID=UPI003466939E
MTPQGAPGRPGAAERAKELGELTLRLIRMPSVSGSEAAVADFVEERLRRLGFFEVFRLGDAVVARSDFGRDRRVLLAGHLDTVPDTVPPQPAELVDGAVTGRGAVDMKGGLAVLLRLAEHAVRGAEHDCTLVFYDQEEVGSHRSGMHRLSRLHPELLRADAAILLEPTGGWLEPGCQGSLRVSAAFHGRAAHTARPWQGVNAVEVALPAVERCASHKPEVVTLDGLRYPQALQVVGVAAGGDSNVVPDRCVVHLNARYAPNRTRDEVLAELRELLGPDARDLEVTLDSPAAPPSLGHRVLTRLSGLVGERVRPKLGWTDVGRLAQLGVPAANFGPGDPELAHGPRERVGLDELVEVYDVLERVMSG